MGEGARFIVKFKKARVKQEHAHLLTDTEFVLQNEHNKWVWTWGSVKDKQIIAFLKLYNQGEKQSEIAEYMGVQRARVSKIKQKAIHLGYLTEKGQLTQSGMNQIL
jgi:DNA-directed RNA polymerase specialized sigma subunit